ncbi:MAG TPA: DEAD/DEAH box helicase, partial [Polyangiaceae bacterium]|nr:DEAD/DEAH box helicase [Polyangiaceae bacterium]
AAHFLRIDAVPGTTKAPTKRGEAHPEALVIVPTRELAAQVRGELEWLFADLPRKLGVECVTGGTAVFGERRMLSRGPRVIVATPGRLLDHMNSGAIKADAVAHVILDEADQMLDMGFKEELDAIVQQLPESRRSHMISATFPHEVLRLAQAFQKEAVHIAGTELGKANADIEHIAYLIHAKDAYASIVNLLLLGQGERCLVFVRRRADASELAEMLAEDGFSALPFSGELPQAQRTRTLNAFRSGIVSTLISTDVAARGIDVPDIATVIHAEAPTSPDVYTHRSGRTGRAGRKGKSLLLVPMRSQRRIEQILYAAKVQAQWQPVPNASKVMKAAAKQARTALHQQLTTQTPPAEAELAYAASLLEKTDPKLLVATLLAMATPKLPREPFEINAVERATSAPRDRHSERDHRSDRSNGAHRSNNAHRSDRTDRSDGFEPFQTNWGTRYGATAARLLSHLCRRCDVTRQQIGAIDIREDGATFGVASEIADKFEAIASKKDPRDPHVRIFRFKGAAQPKHTPKRDPQHDRPRRPGPKQTGATPAGPHRAGRGRSGDR